LEDKFKRILCTHNDGGVGKTTLAAHAAGILIDQGKSVLMVDCDDQADLWQFFTRGVIPNQNMDSRPIQNHTILWNPNRTRIPKVELGEHNHAILDIDTPLSNTVEIILGEHPDLVLVPINTSQEIKALRNLPRTLQVFSNLAKNTGVNPRVIVVPLGVSEYSVKKVVERIEPTNRPNDFRLAPAFPNLQEEMQKAVYSDYRYIWSNENQDPNLYNYDLYNYFDALLTC